MAATINDRDNLIDGSTRTHPVTLPDDVNVSGDVTGTLNGVPVQDVIDAAYTPGGDYTVDILENSGTTVTVNSSTLFEMPGSGSGGTFIGSGGIIGRNAAGDAKVTINSNTGLLTAEDAIISGTIQAGSVIAAGATIAGETASDVVSNADDGYQAYADTISFRTPGAPSNNPVIGSITGSANSVGSLDITLNWTYTQGAIPADHFILYYNQSTVDPTTSSPILAIVDGANRSFRIPGVPVENNYRVGIVAARAWSGGVAKGSIVNSWVRNGGTPVLQAALDYSYITGTKPDANATSNFFTQGAGNPTGGADGDAYWNTSNSTMWFNIGGTWTRGGTINASQITTGTLAAARIAANSITSDKINVSTLSAITANLGTVNAGSITGSAGINVTGQAIFNGSPNIGGFTVSLDVNRDLNANRGVQAFCPNTGIAVVGAVNNSGSGGEGVRGIASNTGGVGVRGSSSGTSGVGVWAEGSSGNTALRVTGNISQESTGSPSTTLRNVSITNGLSVNSGTASFGAISTSSTSLVTNLNADRLDNYHGASFLRTMGCDTGTATVAGSSLLFLITLAGIRSRGDGIQMIVENSPSDIRLKTNVDYDQPLGIDYLKKLDTISFNYTDYDTDKRHWGLVAQQVRAALDDFGIDDNQPFHKVGEDGYQSVDLIAHIVPLIKSVQELHDIIEAQNNKIEALENELRGLHKKNSGKA